MKKNKILTIFIALALVFACFPASAFALEDPNVIADTIVLADMDSGVILYEKNMTKERSPASLTKIMTGLLAVEAIENGIVGENDIITAPKDCQQGLDEESSTANPPIEPGEEMRFIDVLYCALLSSANEACNVIGYAVSGSVDNFVDQMNLRARELGAEHTHFSDPNGLTNENHYTTAYDLYLITKEAMNHPLFATVVNTEAYVVAPTNVHEEQRTLNNSNALLTTHSVYGEGYKYEGVSGVKTGYTRSAGYCLVSTCQRNGMNILCIIMGCNGWLNTGSEDYGNFSGSIKLYDWVFANFGYRTIIEAGTLLGEKDVRFAANGERAQLRPEENLRLLLPVDLPDDQIETRVEIYDDALTAPVEAGTQLGAVRISVSGQEYTSVPMYQKTDIEASRKLVIESAIKDFFAKPWVLVVLVGLLIVLIALILIIAGYKRSRREHARARRKAEEKRAEQQRIREDSARKAAQAVNWRDSLPSEEEIHPIKKMDPSERKAVETDLDELLKSLGLGDDGEKED